MPKAVPKDGNRWWCFTVNNPNDHDDQQLSNLVADPCFQYMCYGLEKGEEKTPHYQAYLELLKPQRFSWVKKRITRAHWEERKGSRDQARNYCFKEDKNAKEHGRWVPDRQGQRNDLIAVQRLLEDSSIPIVDIATDHFVSFCRYNRFFSDYRAMYATERNAPTQVYVFYGTTGTGKTRAAYDMNCHQMDYISPFFTDPLSRHVLLFDDVSNPVHLFGRRLFLRITDRYPMKVRCLGKYVEWNPKVIIFTTNENPASWNLDPACTRRITACIAFPVNPGWVLPLPDLQTDA